MSTRKFLPSLQCLVLLLIFADPEATLAQPATVDGNLVRIPAVQAGAENLNLVLEVQQGTDPLQLRVAESNAVSGEDFVDPAIFNGRKLSIPQVLLGGVRYRVELGVITPEMLVVESVELLNDETPNSGCRRPDSDPSHGPDNPQILAGGFLVPPQEIFDGGPGIDGIPAIGRPQFDHPSRQPLMLEDDLVIGVKIGDQVRAYPHYIMDWHEIVNDHFLVDGVSSPFSINYCPLTGSAMLWEGNLGHADPSFGVSGLLYNSNLVMYDRETASLWSQMLEQSISGPRLQEIPERVQVIETTWSTWKEMYPNSPTLTTETGFSRQYNQTPYFGYTTSTETLFPAANPDSRLHPKERVAGINVGNTSKAYPIRNFGVGMSVVNERVGTMDVVVVGSSTKNLGAIFNRQLEDCATLEFTAVQDQLPIVMTDNEGSSWDVFGNAVSGPRAGSKLAKTNSYIAYWFAWSAFFPGAEIYQ